MTEWDELLFELQQKRSQNYSGPRCAQKARLQGAVRRA